MRTVKIQQLTPGTFSPFGNVIERSGEKREETSGSHNWYGALASVDGAASVSVNILEMLWRPFILKMFESHAKTTETLIPMDGKGFIASVMPPGEADPEALRVFWVPADKGVTLHAGTWHFVPHTFESSSYCACIFRGQTGADDMNFHELKECIGIETP